MKSVFSLLILFMFLPLCIGQPEVVWEKTYGGSRDDVALDIIRCGDEGFIIAGYSRSFGLEGEGLDVYLLKVDGDGDKLWEKTYGGDKTDYAQGVVESGDGGFVVVGYTESLSARIRDVYALKVDGDGDKVWEKIHGGDKTDLAYDVVRSGDGGFIVVGQSTSFGGGVWDVYLLKMDGMGDRVWEKTYGVSKVDYCRCVTGSGDGGFVVAGSTYPPGREDTDVYVLKIDSQGNLVWNVTFGGSSMDMAWDIVGSGEGGFVVAGESHSSDTGKSEVYLLKIDGDGDRVWEKTYSTSGGLDRAKGIVECGDGGFVVAGDSYTLGAGGYSLDVYLLKIDDDGNMVWEITYGGSDEDVSYGIVQGGDGEYVVAGGTKSFDTRGEDVYAIKIRDKPSTPIAEFHTYVLALVLLAVIVPLFAKRSIMKGSP